MGMEQWQRVGRWQEFLGRVREVECMTLWGSSIWLAQKLLGSASV